MWRQKFLNNNKHALNSAMKGWIYTVQTDVNHALQKTAKIKLGNYSYDHLKLINKDELIELENLNQATDRSLDNDSDSDIAILGCGPRNGNDTPKKERTQSKNLYLRKKIRQNPKFIAPFTRYWPIHLEQSLISQVAKTKTCC